MATYTVSEARARLPELLDRIADGEEITITRHGEASAVMVRPDALHPRRAVVAARMDEARRIGRMIEEASHRPLPPPTMSVERAEELVAGIRADRDSD